MERQREDHPWGLPEIQASLLVSSNPKTNNVSKEVGGKTWSCTLAYTYTNVGTDTHDDDDDDNEDDEGWGKFFLNLVQFLEHSKTLNKWEVPFLKCLQSKELTCEWGRLYKCNCIYKQHLQEEAEVDTRSMELQWQYSHNQKASLASLQPSGLF